MVRMACAVVPDDESSPEHDQINWSDGGCLVIDRRLKVARTEAGLSLRDLEARLGRRMTAQALSKYDAVDVQEV